MDLPESRPATLDEVIRLAGRDVADKMLAAYVMGGVLKVELPDPDEWGEVYTASIGLQSAMAEGLSKDNLKMADKTDDLDEIDVTPEMITAGAVALRARDDAELRNVTLVVAEMWAETVISAALAARPWRKQS